MSAETLSSSLVPEWMEALGEPARLKALTHPIRWQVLWLLEQREHHLCVGEVTEQIQGSSLAMISYHLRYLRKAGWVASEQQGRHVYYFLKRERFQAASQALAVLGIPNAESAIL